MKWIVRLFTGSLGALLFGVLAPLLYMLFTEGTPTKTALALCALGGAVLGAFIGARYPSIFRFFVEAIFDV